MHEAVAVVGDVGEVARPFDAGLRLVLARAPSLAAADKRFARAKARLPSTSQQALRVSQQTDFSPTLMARATLRPARAMGRRFQADILLTPLPPIAVRLLRADGFRPVHQHWG